MAGLVGLRKACTVREGYRDEKEMPESPVKLQLYAGDSLSSWGVLLSASVPIFQSMDEDELRDMGSRKGPFLWVTME